MATIKVTVVSTKNKPKSERTFFDLDKLKNGTLKAAYQSELASKFAPLLLLESQQAQELYDDFTKSITATAKNVLGKRRKTRRRWVTGEVLDCCERRRELKRKKNEGIQQKEEYRKVNREVRQLLKKANEDWAEEQAKLVEDGFEANNARKVFKESHCEADQQTNQHHRR